MALRSVSDIEEGGRLRVKQVRGSAGCGKKHLAVLRGLGLGRRTGRVVERENTPSIRGMIQKVIHMVEVERIDAADAEKS